MIPHCSRSRWSDAQVHKERVDDGRRNLPLPQDYSTDTLSVSSESTDSSLQAWERVAIRAFGPGAMDPRPNQNRRKLLN
jgi:hypothetical protein